MSQIPPHATLPKCTRTVVLDLIFMRKYNLTFAQTTILSYLMMLKNWSTCIDNYYLLTTDKIISDLKFGIKTIEASLTQLKKLGLIETQLLKVEEWYSNSNFRGVKLTEMGSEYNLSYYKPEEHQLILELKTENENLRIEIEEAQQKFKRLEESESLVPKSATLKPSFPTPPLTEKKLPTTPKKIEVEKIQKNRGDNNTTYKDDKNKILYTEQKKFQKDICWEYSQMGKIICNDVEGWDRETQFFINSYNRLSIITPNKEQKQLNDPNMIRKFWDFLFHNQDHIGKIVKKPLAPDIKELLAYQGKTIQNGESQLIVNKIVAVVGGVKVEVEDRHGQVFYIKNRKKLEVLDIEFCKGWLERGYNGVNFKKDRDE